MTAGTGHRPQHPPLWRDIRVLHALAQIVAAAAVAVVVAVLWWNLTNNLRRAGLTTDFSFLTQPLGVDIAGSGAGPGTPIWRGLLVGVKNTFALVVVGVPLLTILGVVIGVGRLSTNWLVARMCAFYVEMFRNLPPLLIIFSFFNAVVLRLPLLEDSWNPMGLAVVNNRFIAVTGFSAQPGFGVYWLIIGATLLAAVWLWVWRTRRWERTGSPHHRLAWSGGILGAVTVIAFLVLDGPVALSIPVLEGRVLEGGFRGLGSYFAVLVALVLYTASHVAEIVRGSILAVPRGQTEAANALALSPWQRLRYVILPQAMRIAIPPTISQFLNFTKNTSLAIAVGYAEITRIVFQTIGNAQPAPQLVAVLMLAYLVFSLTISAVVNILNRRLRYVTT
ncbi:MAG: ABC transporter permease subunit [Actinobacteria bacterium]|nr:ABC transporter permease subunit [Actinomycetota bacterium]